MMFKEALICTDCGTVNDTDAVFCKRCGKAGSDTNKPSIKDFNELVKKIQPSRIEKKETRTCELCGGAMFFDSIYRVCEKCKPKAFYERASVVSKNAFTKTSEQIDGIVMKNLLGAKNG